MSETRKTLRITSARALNPRSLRLEFSNGDVRLFDRHRLRGPAFIPLMNEEIFTCGATYIYDRSVHYDDNATAKEYVKTKREIIGERIAIFLFPVMALAGIIGIVWWWINN